MLRKYRLSTEASRRSRVPQVPRLLRMWPTSGCHEDLTLGFSVFRSVLFLILFEVYC